jgi:hypothetical protein
MMLNQGVSNGGKYEMEEIGRLSYWFWEKSFIFIEG